MMMKYFSMGNGNWIDVVVVAVVGLMAATGVSAIKTNYDPLKSSDFCRRHGHATAKIKDRVYIDGGVINVRFGDPKNYTVEHLLYLDLNNDEARIPALSGPLKKPSAVPNVVGGQLWADEVNERLFAFGGDFADDTTPDSNPAVWTFDPWNNTWASIPIETSENVTRRSFGASATIQDEGKAYYLGGWIGERNVAGYTGPKQAASDLLIFDMVDWEWRKDSGPEGPPRVEGVLVYIPAGDTGLLVSFGGVYVNPNGTVPAPMEDIDIYDPTTGHWSRVRATGTVPETRRLFCAGSSSASDGSSHNIYLYGGAATNNTIGYGDVYILTMPSFRWIKWWPTADDAIRPHNTLTCNVVKGSQMLVMGGYFPGDDKCDSPEAFGIHNMDLSNHNPEKAVWYGYTKSVTSYLVPEAIYKVIGGSETGNANVRAPEGGFNNSFLETLFSRSLDPTPRRAPTRTPEKSKGLPKPALIGIALGVLVVVILILVGALLFIKRIKNKRKAELLKSASEQQGLPLVPTPGHRLSEVPGSPPPMSPHSPYPYDRKSGGQWGDAGHTVELGGRSVSAVQELSSEGIRTSYPSQPVELDSTVYSGSGSGGGGLGVGGGAAAGHGSRRQSTGSENSSKAVASATPQTLTQVSGTSPTKRDYDENEAYSDPQRIPLLQ